MIPPRASKYFFQLPPTLCTPVEVFSDTQGGSTSNNHAVILGVFQTMVIGMWGSGFELVVDPFRLKKQGMIELTTFMLGDVALKYPQAFVVAQVQEINACILRPREQQALAAASYYRAVNGGLFSSEGSIRYSEFASHCESFYKPNSGWSVSANS